MQEEQAGTYRGPIYHGNEYCFLPPRRFVFVPEEMRFFHEGVTACPLFRLADNGYEACKTGAEWLLCKRARPEWSLKDVTWGLCPVAPEYVLVILTNDNLDLADGYVEEDISATLVWIPTPQDLDILLEAFSLSLDEQDPDEQHDALDTILGSLWHSSGLPTPLDYLHRYWRQVAPDDRLRFLVEMLTPNERRAICLGLDEED